MSNMNIYHPLLLWMMLTMVIIFVCAQCGLWEWRWRWLLQCKGVPVGVMMIMTIAMMKIIILKGPLWGAWGAWPWTRHPWTWLRLQFLEGEPDHVDGDEHDVKVLTVIRNHKNHDNVSDQAGVRHHPVEQRGEGKGAKGSQGPPMASWACQC